MRIRHLAWAAALGAFVLGATACNDARDAGSRTPADQPADQRGASDRGVSGTTGAIERSADQVGEALSDAAITAKVQSKFVVDDQVKSHKIDVDTNDHVVTLKGDVDSKAESQRATQIAMQTDGVKTVVNELRVNPTLKHADDRTRGTSGQVERSADRAAGAVTDSWITGKIQSQFIGEDLVKARRIDVDTKDGVVTLKGTVNSEVERDKAAQIARQTDGVKSVNNTLKIDASVR
jgi:hyperosmotically inducible periplasmic protein